LSCFTDELEHFSRRFRASVTHLQSLTTGLCPGTRQFTYFRRLSIPIVYLLVSVIIPKSGPTCALKKFYLDVSFSNARWLSIIVSCQTVGFSYFKISLNIYRQLLF
jgi:hypothetical protein